MVYHINGQSSDHFLYSSHEEISHSDITLTHGKEIASSNTAEPDLTVFMVFGVSANGHIYPVSQNQEVGDDYYSKDRPLIKK